MTALDLYPGWPNPEAISIRSRDGIQQYLTPDGEFYRTTSILNVSGLGKDALIRWGANTERAAVLEAATDAFAEGQADSPADFQLSVEARLGKARSHQRILAKAGDIGTEIHERIRWHLAHELGLKRGPEPRLSEPAAIGFSSWRAWWASARLRPVRVEQPVWDPGLGYAGTIDLVAEALDGCEFGASGTLVVPDWKSASGIYDTHHMQLSAYVMAARRWARVEPGPIVWIPKSAQGSLEVKPHKLGHLYDGRVLSLEDLMDGFRACLTLYRLFVATLERTTA